MASSGDGRARTRSDSAAPEAAERVKEAKDLGRGRDTIRAEGQTISAATSSLLTDRTAESGVLKGWISERLPGKQGAERHGAPERGCLSGGRLDLNSGVAPVRAETAPQGHR